MRYENLLYVIVLICGSIPFTQESGFFIRLPDMAGISIVDFAVFFIIGNVIIVERPVISILFLFYLLVWVLLSLDIYSSVKSTLYALRPFLYLTLLTGKFERVSVRKLDITMYVALFIYCVITFADYFRFVLVDSDIEKVRSTYHNDLFFILLLVPITLKYLLSSNLINGYLVCIVLIFAKLLIAMSRGNIIIAFCIVLVILLTGRFVGSHRLSSKSILIIIAPVIFFFLLGNLNLEGFELFINTISGRFLDYNDSDWQDVHLNSRFPMYVQGIKEIISSPLIGNGFGFQLYIKEWNKYIFYLDSSLLTTLLLTGLLGLYFVIRLYFGGIFKIFLSKRRPHIISLEFWMSMTILLYLFILNASMVSSGINILIVIFIIRLKLILNSHEEKIW